MVSILFSIFLGSFFFFFFSDFVCYLLKSSMFLKRFSSFFLETSMYVIPMAFGMFLGNVKAARDLCHRFAQHLGAWDYKARFGSEDT